jgi:hypothetical protein
VLAAKAAAHVTVRLRHQPGVGGTGGSTFNQ